jgi:hypothetical protein
MKIYLLLACSKNLLEFYANATRVSADRQTGGQVSAHALPDGRRLQTAFTIKRNAIEILLGKLRSSREGTGVLNDTLGKWAPQPIR